MKKIFVVLVLMLVVVFLAGCIFSTPEPTAVPTPEPTAVPTPEPTPVLHKNVVIVRDPKASAFMWSKMVDPKNLPMFIHAYNPGTENRLYFPRRMVLSIHLTHDTLVTQSDGSIRDMEGTYFYLIANGAFPNGLSAAGYYVKVDHVKDIE